MPDWVWPAGLGVLGAIVGSFLATLVIRWPQERSVVGGRSACDGCGRTLRAWELVPLFSALASRGRCQSCSVTIDPRHWQIELGCAALGVISGIAVPGPIGVAGAVLGWLLLALAALDVAEFWLPDRLTGALAAMGLVSMSVAPPAWPDRVIGGAAGFLSLWLIAFAYRRVRGREGLGGGDPKLFGAIGLWVGWAMLPFVLLLACVIGLAAVLASRLRGQAVAATDWVPFGALMAIAAYPVWLVMVASGL
ncbi:prepilin peptidase [Sphingomonas panacisoli]|uniref:Prepilin leader peptidase/N-methyltransferase n=1 Tax=Sphingomonas panacisoli TaxID=1813879 RepID=A0A5B8LHJ6_9SPHN|nr:A24 family peptidase [Sphingomonas panacisoli]QDZ07778.1 prepilin peptidase [Sphingomonas panacisoli]